MLCIHFQTKVSNSFLCLYWVEKVIYTNEKHVDADCEEIINEKKEVIFGISIQKVHRMRKCF